MVVNEIDELSWKLVLLSIDSCYCAFHKHANFQVQKPPSQLHYFFAASIIITLLPSQAMNLETQKHRKGIKIRQSQITNHDLLNPILSKVLFPERSSKMIDSTEKHNH